MSREQCFFTFKSYVGSGRIHCGLGSFTSYDDKNDLQQKQETIQKSKDSSVLMTAHGTTPTTEEATEHVCDWDIVQVQLLKESPAVLSLGKLCEENGYPYEWHPYHPSYLIKNGRNTECKTDNPHQTCRQPNTRPCSGRPETDTSCGRPRATCGHRNTRTASTVHRRIDEKIFKFGTRISNRRGHTTFSNSSFPASPTKTFFKKCRRTKVARAPHNRNPDDRADRIKIAERYWSCNPWGQAERARTLKA